jgi:hypothetical protein
VTPAFFIFAARYNREGVSMKRFSFLLAMLAILLAFGLAFVSCDNGSGTTGGGNTPSGGASTFTLTGIPSQYNGKYAWLQGESASGEYIYGAQSANSQGFTLVPISNGRASFPLVRQGGFPYNGTEVAHVFVGIFNQATMTGETTDNYIALISFLNVPFTNGSAAKSWADGTVQ